MTLEDLADHMRRVRLGEVAPADIDEVDPESVQRWEELLRRLTEPTPNTLGYCLPCEYARTGRLDLAGFTTHVGCYYA